jgi:2-oxoglutarate dehydrogenase E1 component
VQTALAAHPTATVRWVQEEPENMGAWGFVRDRLARAGRRPVTVVARPESASTATGSQTVHEREQAALLDAAFAAG